MGSPNLPSVAGRLQAAAAVVQEGPISISVLRLPCPLSSQLPTSRVSTSLRRRSFAVLSLRGSSPDSPFSPGWLRHESTIRSTSCSANIVIRTGLAYFNTPTANRARHRGSDCCCPRVLLMRLRFKQSIPRRPRPLASRGISWHPLGIPLARIQGWPSRPSTTKHHQASSNRGPDWWRLDALAAPAVACTPTKLFCLILICLAAAAPAGVPRLA